MAVLLRNGFAAGCRAVCAEPSSAHIAHQLYAPRGGHPCGAALDDLVDLVRGGRGRVVCVTGAGISTESGIPDYRSPEGSYSKGHKPMQHWHFIRYPSQRQRYWARSLRGYEAFSTSKPNAAHYALAALEDNAYISGVITQNVDRLHQRAGTRNVVDLHGRNDEVQCLTCQHTLPRKNYQMELARVNASWIDRYIPPTAVVDLRADGDAHLSVEDFAGFVVPGCKACGGVMMPRVIFFGGSLEPSVKQKARDMVENAEALLVLGSSVQVASAFRLVSTAVTAGKPVAIVNIGETRADSIVPSCLKKTWQCGAALKAVCLRLGVTLPAM